MSNHGGKKNYIGNIKSKCLESKLHMPYTRAGFHKRGPRAPLGATDRFSGGHEQRPSLGSFAVILHNPSVTIY